MNHVQRLGGSRFEPILHVVHEGDDPPSVLGFLDFDHHHTDVVLSRSVLDLKDLNGIEKHRNILYGV